MPSEARQKKIMEKLNRTQKCSILGPQNLGSGGAGPPGPPPGSAPVHYPSIDKYTCMEKVEWPLLRLSGEVVSSCVNFST